ncbi:MAG TPA: BlaI/MecI/CopY family transcriptional regulator [Acetivibrio sp.]|nr:BlaI/MecI/CopY family transcriptional regulator [Acetivibrio sp.]
MKAESQITESELEVMKILWEFGKATSSQIIEKLTETTEWKPKTIQTLITRLVTKGAVGAEKINSKSFIYYPIVSEEQYKSYANKSFLQKLYNGSVNLMLASFVKDQKLSKKDLEFLKQLLDEEE